MLIGIHISLVRDPKLLRSPLGVTGEAENIRVVSADKLSVQVLVTALAGVAPPVVSLTVADQIILRRRGASKSSLATADTFLSFVTENKYLARVPSLMLMDCLRFVAVQAVTGVLGQDERHAVELLVTQ